MIQMPLALGKTVASNRADEMVLAGAAPSAAPGSDPVAHVHRGTSFIVLVDGAIVWRDSPLVEAVTHGQVLMLDEADKAPLEVVCVLKALAEVDDARKTSESFDDE